MNGAKQAIGGEKMSRPKTIQPFNLWNSDDLICKLIVHFKKKVYTGQDYENGASSLCFAFL
jgi:hypothetical protein